MTNPHRGWARPWVRQGDSWVLESEDGRLEMPADLIPPALVNDQPWDVSFAKPDAIRFFVKKWLERERLYADEIWAPEDAAAAHRACVIGEGPTTWHDWAGNYIKRAEFGLDSPQGRQALGKAIVTLTHVLETAVDEYGPMPKPGVPSGVIE